FDQRNQTNFGPERLGITYRKREEWIDARQTGGTRRDHYRRGRRRGPWHGPAFRGGRSRRSGGGVQRRDRRGSGGELAARRRKGRVLSGGRDRAGAGGGDGGCLRGDVWFGGYSRQQCLSRHGVRPCREDAG